MPRGKKGGLSKSKSSTPWGEFKKKEYRAWGHLWTKRPDAKEKGTLCHDSHPNTKRGETRRKVKHQRVVEKTPEKRV